MLEIISLILWVSVSILVSAFIVSTFMWYYDLS